MAAKVPDDKTVYRKAGPTLPDPASCPGEAAVNTWNARRAAVGKWLGWCHEQGWDAPAVPATAGRSTPPDSNTLVRSRTAIDRLISRRDVHVREKALWRMLYETCARAEELLQLNIEDLDLAARSCPSTRTAFQNRMWF